MHDNLISFQLATHFLSRIALRLEYLFKTITQACDESHELIHRFALKSVIEVVDIIEKPELKSRFLKELIRIEHILRKPSAVEQDIMADQLSTQIYSLSHSPGPFGLRIHEDEFLKTLRQILHPNTKECEFNSPQLVLWFDSEPLLRQKTIKKWLDCVGDLKETVDVYLSLLRNASHYIPIMAHHGFYQHALSPKAINHLILLKIDKSLSIIPKLQLGHHNLTIRLYDLITAYEIRDRSIQMEIAFSQI